MSINKNARRDIGRALRNFKYERTPGGILIRGGLNKLVNGAFKHTLYQEAGNDAALDPNKVVDEGLIKMLNVFFNGEAAITAWYVSLFSGDVSPAEGWTGANWWAAATEQTNYTPGTRPLLVTETATTPSVGNVGHEAMFTFVGTGRNAYGAVLVSQSAKTAGGVLFAGTRFANPRLNLGAPDRLGVEYVVTAQDAG